MSGNRSFERSMNGINNIEVNEVEFPDGSIITSAANLVQLDTNNNFTAFNTFNTNLPTSSVDTALGNINDNTILNKFAGDKLYPASADVNECFDDVSITDRTLTFSRVDNANPEDIIIPETDLTAVSEAFDDVSIASRTLTFSRVDNANPQDIIIPETDLTAVSEAFDDVSIASRTLTFSRVDNANPQDIIIPETDLTGVEAIANGNYNGVSINGQDLTFTRPSTSNPTTITIPSGGGGTFVGMRAYLSSTSGATASPWIFPVSNYCSPSTLYNNTTGKFLIPSDGKYYFSLLVNVLAAYGNDFMNFGLSSPAGTSPFVSYVRGLKSFFTFSSLPNRNYHMINVSGVFDLTAGTQLQWGNNRAVSYILSGTLETSICCFKVG